jgi:hypothetical protein
MHITYIVEHREDGLYWVIGQGNDRADNHSHRTFPPADRRAHHLAQGHGVKYRLPNGRFDDACNCAECRKGCDER